MPVNPPPLGGARADRPAGRWLGWCGAKCCSVKGIGFSLQPLLNHAYRHGSQQSADCQSAHRLAGGQDGGGLNQMGGA